MIIKVDMKKIIKLGVLLLLVSGVKATTMSDKERALAKMRRDDIITDKEGNIVEKNRNITKDKKVLYDRIGDIDDRVVLAKKEKGMEEWRKEGNEVKLILWKNIRAQRMRAQRLAREAENRDNSNLNHEIVEEEVVKVGEEQKQECVSKQKSGLPVLSKQGVVIIMYKDDLVAFKKVAWENMGMTKDEMLAKACGHGSLKVASYLIKEGADVEARDEYGNTLLHLAVVMQRLKVVELLIENGANVDSRDKYGGTPLYDTLRIGDVSLAKLLVEAGADIDSKDKYGETVIEHGLWLSTWSGVTAEEKENALKVVDYLKSVVKERGGVI